MNYAVIVTEGVFPTERNSSQTLLGIYPTSQEANFIINVFNKKYRNQYSIDSIETEFEPTTTLVAHYLNNN